MKIEVQILKCEDGNLIAWANGTVSLFEFVYREELSAWLFWFNGWRASRHFIGTREDFPMQFFKDACRAKFFFCADILPDTVEITEGEKLIK